MWRSDESRPVRGEDSGANLSRVLSAHEHLIDDAVEALPRLQLQHYERLDTEALRERVRVLYGLVLACLEQDTLEPIQRHSENIAADRLESGFELGEVQSAFDLLEDAAWQVAASHMPPDRHGAARSRIGRVLAAGKDGLARGWVTATAGRAAAQNQQMLTSVVESVASMHPTVPKDHLEEMAREALARTENARIKSHRLPLAHHEVRERAAQWERARRA